MAPMGTLELEHSCDHLSICDFGRYDWLVIPFIVLFLVDFADLVCAIAFVVDQNMLKQTTGASIFSDSVLDWTVAFLACSVTTTLYCTGKYCSEGALKHLINYTSYDRV